jgi:4-carboxymuconolactone decarboxylase
MLYNPKLGWLLKDVDRYLRFGTNLPRRVVILATLVAAREMNSPVIWSRKEAEARQEGLEPHLIDVVKYHKSVSGLAEDEALIISYGRELFEKRKVRSETFAHAVKLLGGQGVVTMTSVMGFYTSLALLLRAVDMQLVPGEKPCTAPPLAPGEAYRCLP